MKTVLTAEQKALRINLDSGIYGTFAEIGAGQDVAGTFFKAGGASGTIAKSISAYDMTFSDAIYGKEKSGRYVCHSRVQKMVAYEYDLLIERLGKVRENTKFFAFANTVVARNYQGTNKPHGWLALRYQHESGAEFSDVVVHIKMHDNTNKLQQTALGVFGTNLIDASFHCFSNIDSFIESLMDGLTTDRIEIDFIELKGPAFNSLDNRIVNLKLIEKNITSAVLFNKNGEVVLADDELYKKNILVSRGSYRPPTNVNVDIMKKGFSAFATDNNISNDDVYFLAEITLSNINSSGDYPYEDFLARVDLLSCMNCPVMITNYPQYYKLTNFLQRFRSPNIALVLGAYNFMQIFDSAYNQKEGYTLEALGSLIKPNMTIYLYPYREDSENDDVISLKNMKVKEKNKHLLEHLRISGQVKDITNFDDKLLHIYSKKVLEMIVNSKEGWEQYVPAEIAKTINDKCLFGHPCKI